MWNTRSAIGPAEALYVDCYCAIFDTIISLLNVVIWLWNLGWIFVCVAVRDKRRIIYLLICRLSQSLIVSESIFRRSRLRSVFGFLVSLAADFPSLAALKKLNCILQSSTLEQHARINFLSQGNSFSVKTRKYWRFGLLQHITSG